MRFVGAGAADSASTRFTGVDVPSRADAYHEPRPGRREVHRRCRWM